MSLNALGAQAHGTGNLKLVGQWLQLTLVAVTFLCLLLSVPYFFTDKLVELVGSQGNSPRVCVVPYIVALFFGQAVQVFDVRCCCAVVVLGHKRHV